MHLIIFNRVHKKTYTNITKKTIHIYIIKSYRYVQNQFFFLRETVSNQGKLKSIINVTTVLISKLQSLVD